MRRFLRTMGHFNTSRRIVCRRRRHAAAYLLKQLADCRWDLAACAKLLACSKNELILRLENSGFAYLLHQHVLDAARAAQRRR